MNSQTNQKLTEATPVVQQESILGEGPLWYPAHQMLYWVDILQKIVHGFEPHTGRHREWVVPKRVGTVALASGGNLLLGLQGEIAELDPSTGVLTSLVTLESDIPDNRCNDGKCDPAGRFWVGTMHIDGKPGAGSLYCVERSLQIHKVLDGLTIANGMGWSPDGAHMYFIDSSDRAVKRFNFHRERASLTEEKVILRFDNAQGLPDGMCVDNEGMLWIGFWGGGRVGRYDPETGKHLTDISVPAPHVTSCCFGGKNLTTLYITTAREGLAPDQLTAYPLSGSLFSCETGVAGSDATSFELVGA